MAPTIKDIAKIVGVAPSTVGRALGNNPRIGLEMRQRIHQVAAQIGYVASSNAQAMRALKSKLVGFIVPNVEDNDSATIAKEIADCCNAEGLQLVLAMSEDKPEREQAQLRALVGAKAAAVVIVPTSSPSPESLVLFGRQPLIQVIRKIDSLDLSSFVFDDYSGIHDATAHLLELGHRRIAYLGSSEALTTGRNRLKGFVGAFSRFGLVADESLLRTTNPGANEAGPVFRQLMAEQKPSALVLGGSRITANVVAAISEMGLRVPQELSVVGFGDHGWSRWWGSGLTTIGLPFRELGKSAGEDLVQRVLAAQKGQPEIAVVGKLLSPFLVVRGSTKAHGRVKG